MPAIIAGDEEEPWLDCEGKDLQRILGALRPFPAEEMKCTKWPPGQLSASTTLPGASNP